MDIINFVLSDLSGDATPRGRRARAQRPHVPPALLGSYDDDCFSICSVASFQVVRQGMFEVDLEPGRSSSAMPVTRGGSLSTAMVSPTVAVADKLDRVFQLANVSWPTVGQQPLHRLGSHLLGRLVGGKHTWSGSAISKGMSSGLSAAEGRRS